MNDCVIEWLKRNTQNIFHLYFFFFGFWWTQKAQFFLVEFTSQWNWFFDRNEAMLFASRGWWDYNILMKFRHRTHASTRRVNSGTNLNSLLTFFFFSFSLACSSLGSFLLSFHFHSFLSFLLSVLLFFLSKLVIFSVISFVKVNRTKYFSFRLISVELFSFLSLIE